jgi:uncharacterized membrane protein YhaH (DUF805 family)
MSARDWIDPTRLYNPASPAGRLMYAWGAFIYPLVAMALLGGCGGLVDQSLGYYSGPGSGPGPIDQAIILLGIVVMILGGILVTLRRLRDLGKPGTYILLGLVPLVSLVFWIWLLFAPGTPWPAPLPAARGPSPAPTPPRVPDSARLDRYCSSCGSPLIEGALYCASCGQPVPRTPTSG